MKLLDDCVQYKASTIFFKVKLHVRSDASAVSNNKNLLNQLDLRIWKSKSKLKANELSFRCSFSSVFLLILYEGGVELHFSLQLSPPSFFFVPRRVWRLSISEYLVWGQRANIDRVDLNERRSVSAVLRLRWVFLHRGGARRRKILSLQSVGLHQHQPSAVIYFLHLQSCRWLLPSSQLDLKHQFLQHKPVQSLPLPYSILQKPNTHFDPDFCIN